MPLKKTAVKICGLTRREDALSAAASGADYLGVVSVPDTPRYRPPRDANAILQGLDARSVLVVSDLDLTGLLRAAEDAAADVIQLHGNESPDLALNLRNEGRWEVWKAVRVRNPGDVTEAIRRYGGAVDGLLMDGWHPKKTGGSGVSFPWEEVADARRMAPEGMRIIVAGGLTPENVSRAVSVLRPDVVDVSSGVEEEPGIKNRHHMEAFIRKVREAETGGRP